MPLTFVCQNCGAEFEATRKDAKYCSDRCRQASHRGNTSPLAMPVPKAVTQADIVAAVGRAHAMASDLSRLAAYAEPGVGAKFRRLSREFETSLRNVGL